MGKQSPKTYKMFSIMMKLSLAVRQNMNFFLSFFFLVHQLQLAVFSLYTLIFRVLFFRNKFQSFSDKITQTRSLNYDKRASLEILAENFEVCRGSSASDQCPLKRFLFFLLC